MKELRPFISIVESVFKKMWLLLEKKVDKENLSEGDKKVVLPE